MDATTPNTSMNSPAPRFSPAGQRVGDTERQAVCDRLNAHYGSGRLDADELDQRIDAAMAARTAADLHVLLGDLPTLAPPRATPGVAVLHGTLGLMVLGAAGIVLVMLAGATALAPMVALFSVTGGAMAAFIGAGGTYLVMRKQQLQQRQDAYKVTGQLARPEFGSADQRPVH